MGDLVHLLASETEGNISSVPRDLQEKKSILFNSSSKDSCTQSWEVLLWIYNLNPFHWNLRPFISFLTPSRYHKENKRERERDTIWHLFVHSLLWGLFGVPHASQFPPKPGWPLLNPLYLLPITVHQSFTFVSLVALLNVVLASLDTCFKNLISTFFF